MCEGGGQRDIKKGGGGQVEIGVLLNTAQSASIVQRMEKVHF